MNNKLSILLALALSVISSGAATIHWFSDETFTSAPTDGMVIPLQVTGPNGYRYTLLSYLKNYMGANTTVNITTNYYVYGTNYYVNNSYVSNFFETNILVDATSSNYFATYNYVTNTYQTNVTIEQYLTSNTYVSNYVTTNIYNDTYVSNYFATNLFPTTYVYTTNTIGGDFIANLNGVGTNTTFYGTSEFKGAGNGIIELYDAAGTTLLGGFNGTYWWGNGQGLTNLSSTGGSQVWTNDGTAIYPADQPAPDTSGVAVGPTFAFFNNGSGYVGSNSLSLYSFSSSAVKFPIVATSIDSNNLPLVNAAWAVTDSADWNRAAEVSLESQLSGNDPTTLTNASCFFKINAYDDLGDGTVQLLSTPNQGASETSIKIYWNSDTTFSADGAGNVSASGVFSGDGSGLTNLNNVIETNVYQTFNVKNLTVQSNIFYFQSRPQVVAWSGPTNTLDFSLGQVFTYSTLVPVSITNIIGITNGYQNASLLWLTNTSSTNIAIMLPTGWKTGRGDATSCTNGGVFQVWPAEAGGMRTIATKEYP